MPEPDAPAPDTVAQIEAIFHPRSIAVVGASANPDTPGYDYLHSLQTFGYAGEIYPVNPHAQEILGLPSYPSLREVPGDVDYVISCIPASAVLDLGLRLGLGGRLHLGEPLVVQRSLGHRLDLGGDIGGRRLLRHGERIAWSN